MSYVSWSVVFGEQPSAAKWNILGTNDASFNDGTGIGTGAIVNAKLGSGSVTYDKAAAGFVVQQVSTGFSAAATGTTVIPYDDTVPQNTEGDQYMTQAITPKSASNILIIETLTVLSSSSGTVTLIAALFQDSTASALAAVPSFQLTATAQNPVSLKHTMTAGTASATTFKIRGGASGAGTTTFNGQSGNRRFGGITQSFMQITEVKV